MFFFLQRNLNNELSQNASFMNLTTELFRFTEYYSSLALGENENASLASLNLVVDFMRDLNIRNIQFVGLFENYARLLTQLAKTSCFDCPKFKEHVRLIKTVT